MQIPTSLSEDCNYHSMHSISMRMSNVSKNREVVSFPSKNTKNPSPNVIITSRYTLLSFFPISLFEQFRRLANVYFLILGIIALVGEQTNAYATSVSSAGILLPMIVVVLISVIKNGIEDVKRHRADAVLNAKLTHLVSSDDQVTPTQWQNLIPGEIILLLDGDEIPADIITLACGGIQGPVCYVETAAIDGETNLKPRFPCLVQGEDSSSPSLVTISEDKKKVHGLPKLNIVVTTELPSEAINEFNGSITFASSSNQNETFGLSKDNLLLRGSVLRATEWCIGIVVYTGKDTKLSLNSKRAPSKLSSIDRIVNQTLLIALSAMFTIICVCMSCYADWINKQDNSYYLCINKNDLENKFGSGRGCEDSATPAILTLFTFATLFNNFICISMYVSLEMVYLCQSYFITQDLAMYDSKSNTPAEVHSSGLCADIGQIQYILSDKTGTLTKNNMKLKRITLLGTRYGAPIVSPSDDKSNLEQETWQPMDTLSVKKNDNKYSAGVVDDFLRVCVGCSSVILMPDSHTGQSVPTTMASVEELHNYLQAESADEVALVIGAGDLGNSSLLMVAQEHTSIRVRRIENNVQTFENMQVLAINTFNSDRKRMSVLVKVTDSSGAQSDSYLLLVKGADNTMLPLCSEEKSASKSECMVHIQEFANTGLRTIVMARKYMSLHEGGAWLERFRSASSSINNRREQLEQCAIDIETDLEMLGAVGIEDELQDGVAQAVTHLLNSGLNVWMITGDKAETGQAIARQCAMLSDKQETLQLLSLAGNELADRVIALHNRLCGGAVSGEGTVSPMASKDSASEMTSPRSMALVVDGMSLEGLWKHPDLQAKFTDAVRRVQTVIACRVSPKQKASLVRMVKTAAGSPMTLAIGDGANDVAMIQEARVGVGIAGKEGRHAANSSDFAISQFQYLVPLLLTHGRYNYVRCSNLVLYSFFKNLVLVSILFYYCFVSGFSGTVPLDSLVLSGYNFYLGLPILCVGAMDFDFPKELIMKYPALAYNSGRLGELLNISNMSRWCLLAFAQGLLIFCLVSASVSGDPQHYDFGNLSPYSDSFGLPNKDGKDTGIYVSGFLMFTVCIVAMQYKVVLMAKSRDAIFWFMWVLSFLGYLFFAATYGLIDYLDWYGVVSLALSIQRFWMVLIIVPVIFLLSDLLAQIFLTYFFPTSQDKLSNLYEKWKAIEIKKQANSTADRPKTWRDWYNNNIFFKDPNYERSLFEMERLTRESESGVQISPSSASIRVSEITLASRS